MKTSAILFIHTLREYALLSVDEFLTKTLLSSIEGSALNFHTEVFHLHGSLFDWCLQRFSFSMLSRYVDRYVPPAAHTPTDRYVPANDPGDPYMRRDLGFHHHYRLPPPTGYPYQTHFRFRGFTSYATSGRLGGSPGSSSSSSTTSNQRETFATSPLLRPKVRASTVEFGTAAGTVGGTAITTATAGVGVTVGRHVCTNQVACCGDASTTGRTCCQMRRSLPPGTLPTIPAQTSSW